MPFVWTGFIVAELATFPVVKEKIEGLRAALGGPFS